MGSSAGQDRFTVTLDKAVGGDGRAGYDLDELASILKALNREFRRWATEDEGHSSRQLSRAGMRLALYEWNEGSIEVILGLAGKVRMGVTVLKFATRVARNLKWIMRNGRPPNDMALNEARNYRALTAGRDINIYKFSDCDLSVENLGAVQEAVKGLIGGVTVEVLEGVWLRFCQIDARRRKAMLGVVESVDDSPRRVTLRGGLDKRELLLGKPFPFQLRFRADVEVERDAEGRVRVYNVLRVTEEVRDGAGAGSGVLGGGGGAA